jgi:hypothetical protein
MSSNQDLPPELKAEMEAINNTAEEVEDEDSGRDGPPPFDFRREED